MVSGQGAALAAAENATTSSQEKRKRGKKEALNKRKKPIKLFHVHLLVSCIQTRIFTIKISRFQIFIFLMCLRKRSLEASKQAMQGNTKFESGTKYWYFTSLDVVKHYQKGVLKGYF